MLALAPILIGLFAAYRLYKATFMDILLKRGLALVALFVLLMRQTQGSDASEQPDPMQDAIRGARTYPIYEGVAKALEVVLPQARQRAHDYIDRRRGESAPIPPATTTTTTTPPPQSTTPTTP